MRLALRRAARISPASAFSSNSGPAVIQNANLAMPTPHFLSGIRIR
ncbi:exported protein of unknown function [Candidatus Hydrogenisulfobacillus filiaventi]|uniref:Uncharacterized protein n=1 Tax=Candidatus Hydrogenisulfobacillus filiaventi TaxID=2707344 RepID=A0A6F8ZD24_9FIRM|nr:exported protein of unknown function [Candidatus Hydrogenisulfobacillus filiaventi]